MIRIPFVSLVLFLLAGALPATAQQPGRGPGAQGPGGEIAGRVVAEEGGEPIVGASVAVWSPADQAIVSGDVVKGDGSFRVQGLTPGTYYVRITSIGYESHRSADLTISPASPRSDLGTVSLVSAAVQADEIEVTVERPAVMIAPDRNVYAVREVAPAATNATEVLENVPSIQVDTDGRVSLRGNENVAVQINGRPAPVRGDQLIGFLQQLPANALDRIEVIPTPSAAHDPEGMAGIINIVLKQNTDLGTSFGLTLGAATEERYNLGANVGHQQGPFTLFTTYGFNRFGREYEGINDRRRLGAGGGILSLTEQDVAGENTFGGHNLTNTLEYKVSERDALTSTLVMNFRGSEENSLSAYTELDAAGEVTDVYARPREGEDDSFTFDHTLAWRRSWEPQRHFWSNEFRFNRSTDDDSTLLWRVPGATPTLQLERENNEVDAVNRELTLQSDYTRAFGENSKLEAGYKGSFRRLEREFTVLEDELGTGVWTPSDRSNAFDFEEGVQAVYGVVSHGAGRFQLQGGLRAEYASQDFALTDESFPHDYTSLFPSGIVTYKPSETTEYKLAYSRRVRRPGTQELNPFPTFMDPQNVFIGNPELDPEYTDAVELGYTRSGDFGSLQISPFYRHTSDIIRFIVDTDAVIDDREVTSVTFENLANSDSWGTDVNGTFEIGEWFNGFASFNIFKQVTDGGSVTSLASDAVTWSTRVNGTFALSPTLSLQATSFYRAPMEFETGKFSSFKMTSLTLRQRLFENRATVSLRLNDPFKQMGFKVEAGDENLVQFTERAFNSRVLQLTFQYNFGRAPRVRQPQQPPDGPDTGGGFPQ
ncbi:MAG TPA: TonB-dependent receptor [Gemmatimonadota bacterium]|nr:TonB-dependent receptor [Gemmatimonadota bacterium]